MPRMLLLCLLCVFCVPALAIYRCEINGKTSYGDVPCAEVRDAPRPVRTGTPCGAARSKQQALQQRQAADRMQVSRENREAQEQKEQQKADKLAAARKKKCAGLALRRKWGAEDAAAAAGKGAEKAKRDARRLDEQYEMECGKQLS